ncbi:MAG: 5'-methylthioadenosine/S-adenosylhomocysteine nucleosidase [Cyanobacteria bacterium SBC]|nr:5'-methylthioadenosine/S-adenosylhomocysteine nucleosidase [Cyanobacteria bacterium SBC]
MPCAVILTAIPVEYEAVRSHLTDLREEVHSQGKGYERGQFDANQQRWEVGIAEVGVGNLNALNKTRQAIDYFKPSVAIFVGVAGGIREKDVKIGDVVVATKVYNYELGKVEEKFKSRPEVEKSTDNLVSSAQRQRRSPEWLNRLENQPEVVPNVFIAPIASGEKVIASVTSDLVQFVRDHYNDAIAVEMEGFGFLQATSSNPTNPTISAVVIRGISDLIDGKSEADATGSQEMAAQNASAFAFEVLSRFKILNNHPELAYRGLSILNELLCYPEVSSMLVRSQEEFRKISKQIENVTNHKKLHDLLHSLYNKYNKELQPNHKLKAISIEISLEELRELIFRVDSINLFIAKYKLKKYKNSHWLSELKIAGVEFKRVCDCDNQHRENRLEFAILIIEKVLPRALEMVNKDLEEAASELSLSELINIVEPLLERVVNSCHIEVEKKEKFQQEISQLQELQDVLNNLIDAHSKGQKAEIGVATFRNVYLCSDVLSKIEQLEFARENWFVLQKDISSLLRINVTNPVYELDEISKISANINQKIDDIIRKDRTEKDVHELKYSLLDFCSLVRICFFHVDNSLVTFCQTELTPVNQSLENLLFRLEI